MKSFRINDYIEIVCESQRTRYGFRHLATLLINGIERDTAKCTYQNRTWESYEFQSVLRKIADSDVLTEDERKLVKDFAENPKEDREDSGLDAVISRIAKIGDVFGQNKKESNDWKLRILKAGLEQRGLDIPEDWDRLSEDEKTKRLDAVISLLEDGK
mgnify:CR=1 FL=1